LVWPEDEGAHRPQSRDRKLPLEQAHLELLIAAAERDAPACWAWLPLDEEHRVLASQAAWVDPSDPAAKAASAPKEFARALARAEPA